MVEYVAGGSLEDWILDLFERKKLDVSEFMAGLAIAGTIGQIREENVDELARHVVRAARRIFHSAEEQDGAAREAIP